MVAQAFFYNAIFFTYALVLGTFYDVPAGSTGFYLFPFALGNFLGPLVLGRAVRLGRPQADDRRHLCARRRASRGQRLGLPAGPA